MYVNVYEYRGHSGCPPFTIGAGYSTRFAADHYHRENNEVRRVGVLKVTLKN